MSGAGAAEPDGPHLPLPDQDTEAFWAAAAERRLIARRCRGTGRVYHYPRERVPGTLSPDTEWVELSGRGTIHTYTVVHQAASRAFRERVPYVLALIDLEEGVRVMANIEADPATVGIGQAVRVAWRQDGSMVIPVFVPDADDRCPPAPARAVRARDDDPSLSAERALGRPRDPGRS